MANIALKFSSSDDSLIFFFDEGRFGLKPKLGRLWAKRGVRVIAAVLPGYRNFYSYTGVSSRNGESFSLFLPWVNTEMMNLYLQELSREYTPKTILLIMDQAGWHRSKNLSVPYNIKIMYLPPYSPELNPVEKLWQWLKRHACMNRYYKSEETLADEIEKLLKSLSKTDFMRLCKCSYM